MKECVQNAESVQTLRDFDFDDFRSDFGQRNWQKRWQRLQVGRGMCPICAKPSWGKVDPSTSFDSSTLSFFHTVSSLSTDQRRLERVLCFNSMLRNAQKCSENHNGLSHVL